MVRNREHQLLVLFVRQKQWSLRIVLIPQLKFVFTFILLWFKLANQCFNYGSKVVICKTDISSVKTIRNMFCVPTNFSVLWLHTDQEFQIVL